MMETEYEAIMPCQGRAPPFQFVTALARQSLLIVCRGTHSISGAGGCLAGALQRSTRHKAAAMPGERSSGG